jgi:hypothetical protein
MNEPSTISDEGRLLTGGQMSTYFKDEPNETCHWALYAFHNAIYSKAGEQIKLLLNTLHQHEAKFADDRHQVRQYIAVVEGLRDRLEALGKEASHFRSDLIEDNGCTHICERG